MEYGFVLLLAVLCGVLTVLQFRWTGELAEAEFERLGGKQKESSLDFCNAFDAELRKSCDALVPSGGELSVARIAMLVAQWREGNPRPIFRRIALVEPVAAGVKIQVIDPRGGETGTSDWPAEWSSLKSNLSKKVSGPGSSPPYADSRGLLLEFPIHGSRSSGSGRGNPPDGPPGGGPGGPRGHGPGGPPEGKDGGPSESGWVVLELDEDYLKGTWLPDLAARFLNPGETAFYQVKVSDSATRLIYEAGPSAGLESPLSISFNYQGRDAGGSAGRPGEALWTLETRRQSGALEQLVSSSRRRNLALAVLVNGLILAAGWALVRQTRKSRLLAESQMQFVAGVSHELRTPLTVIRGAAHNLKRGIVQTPDAINRYSGLILQHADQLSEMVQQVLDFSAAKKGSLVSNKTDLSIGVLLREAIANTAAETAGCEIYLSIPDDLPLVEGDAASLRRAFQNLIANGAKHGGSGAWLGISGRCEGSRVQIDIADHGPGIPRQEQAEIFTPFFRGAAAHDTQVRGSGLGLGLVKEIVEAHGGSVSVCSQEGKGATFTIILPVRAGQPTHDSPSATGGR